MARKAANSVSWTQRLAESLRREKKKVAILAVLAVVAAVVGVRLLVKRSAASEAKAGTAEVASPAADGSVQAANPDAQQADPEDPDRQKARPRRNERHLTRDLFAVDLELYPPVETPKPKNPEASPLQPAQPTRSPEEIVRAQAKFLCLQMTIVSDTPIAIINGQILGMGDTIDVTTEEPKSRLRFRVVKITSHACIVAKDGVEVELRMK